MPTLVVFDRMDPEKPPSERNPYAPDAQAIDAAASPPPGMTVGTHRHPSFIFLAVVSILSLASDIATKTWAEKHLDGFPGIVNIWKDHIAFVLAKNKGGAWGLLQATSENVRRPFFLLVSVAAIAFIVTLYRRLLPTQRALKWGLPLVLGGALGNVFDRIRYGHVIDFIDVHLVWKGKDHHWPTFNVADIAICIGVGLMAIDMFTSKRGRLTSLPPPAPVDAPPEPPPPALPPEGESRGPTALAPDKP
jgi:signal peptidase II